MSDSILTTSQYNLKMSAERLGLEDSILNKISMPKEKIEFRLTPVFSDGNILSIRSYIVRFNDTLGPAKGGIRMDSSVTMDEITGLAMEMTWKNSLIRVPFGGGKSGIQLDPLSISARDKEIIIRAFARKARRHMGPELYVPAPDMGTTERDMGHIRDCLSYSDGKAITKGCFVTGKPVLLGGIEGRRSATGRGVVYTIEAACENLGLSFEEITFAIQGFGNVGSEAARDLYRKGASIKAVADIYGGVFHEDGLDIEGLLEYAHQHQTVKGFPHGEEMEREKLFEVECDCLIPAAAAGQITEKNASLVKASIIAEAANSPTTPPADDILDGKDVFIIPDILCNAGGVFVSYLEYVQETQHEQMSESEVNSRLADRMELCFNRVYDYSKKHNRTMRQASMDIAVKRVVEGIYTRGFHP